MNWHSSVFLQLGIGILLIAFSNNFRIENSIDEFAAELENIMNTGDNGIIKYNTFQDRFYQLMDLAELMSDRITKLINASNAPELFIASQKLSVLQEKVENFTLNSKSDSANPKQSTGQSSKEKNAEEYRHHVLVTWTDTAYPPLATLNNAIRGFLRRNMTEVEKLSDYCTRQSSSPAWSATDLIGMINPMVRAQSDMYGPDSLDGIYALFARNLLKLTFYQAICDPSLGRHPDSAPFYHNSGYRVTMNKIFGSMDDTVKWSKAEYEANIQLAASTTDRNNVSLHIDVSFGNMLVIILVLSTYYLLL
ncbi:hypothetical protein DdX_20029 [Ditylenchus destructor]|uniref:Uncharacterized protein n=1 Tax=Ditylenchus destructor TaxID=166010 RepID=A0AAD4MIB0_9BILA|nr:hypothetical protein DdX_20029 [Ditylenchus destructor]